MGLSRGLTQEAEKVLAGWVNKYGDDLLSRGLTQEAEKVLRKPEMLAMVGLSDATIRRMEQASKFPKRIRLGHSCGWLKSEILAFLDSKAQARG